MKTTDKSLIMIIKSTTTIESSSLLDALYRRHEQEKQSRYNERVRKVELLRLLPQFYHCREIWTRLPRLITRDWPACYLKRITNPTARPQNFICIHTTFSLQLSAIAVPCNTGKHTASLYPDSIYLHGHH